MAVLRGLSLILIEWRKAQDCVLAFSECVIPVSLLIVSIQVVFGHRAARAVLSVAQPHEHFESGIGYYADRYSFSVVAEPCSCESANETHRDWKSGEC